MARRPHRLTVLNAAAPQRPSGEFAPGAALPPTGASRRRFLKYAAVTAAIATGGGAGCTRQPRQKLVPRVQMPEETVPGRPLYFSSIHTHDGYARGVLVESHDGRPTKLDGNPDHPASLGGADVWMQSAVWQLYDPDRLATPFRLASVSDWSSFSTWLRAELPGAADGVRLLTGRVTSMVVGEAINRLRDQCPGLVWHRWQPVHDDAERAGLTAALGRPLKPVYDLSKAKVVVSLESDFMLGEPGSLAYARQWADARRAGRTRLWVAESTPTITGGAADECRRMAPADVAALAAFLGGDSTGTEWATRCAADLQAAGPSGLVIAGPTAPPAVHAAAARINLRLGAVGTTVRYIEPPEVEPVDCAASLRDLTADLNAGKVKLLVVAGCDPVTTGPADLDFAAALKKAKVAVSLSTYDDATAGLCEWRLPLSDELEAWGDGRAYDGTYAVCQPLILPLHASRSLLELLLLMLDPISPESGLSAVRGLATRAGASRPDWERLLQRGTAGVPSPSVDVTAAAKGSTTRFVAKPQAAGELTVVVRPDPCLWDGAYGRNAWLAELPQPLTKLSWTEAVLISPGDARRMNLTFGGQGNGIDSPVLKIESGGRSAEVAAFVFDAQPDGVATLHLAPAAYALRTSDRPWQFAAKVSDAGRRELVACTQRDFMQVEDRRVIVKVATYAFSPGDAGQSPRTTPQSFYEPWNYKDRIPDQNKWGMAIDTGACVGCNACVIACQAENNIPTVGKDQVLRGREMQWIRVDRYADAETGFGVFQPMMCQMCENAPCEVVCPVNATVHDMEGLNVQVYNRCIGTRYCSNNCPYKVRHFNFLHYQRPVGTQQLAINPDVSTRHRGIMEKCTYCVQRISGARIESKKENRPIRDGEVVTACQATCPTRAITFGNLNDPYAEITKVQARPEAYGVLSDLMTRPRTVYLPKHVNPVRDSGGAA